MSGAVPLISTRGVRQPTVVDVRSDGAGEFRERGRDATVGASVASQFVVASADVLHERVTAHDHAGAVITFESAHRSQSCLQAAMVGFDPIVRILLSVVTRSGDQFLDHRAQRRARSVTTSIGSP